MGRCAPCGCAAKAPQICMGPDGTHCFLRTCCSLGNLLSKPENMKNKTKEVIVVGGGLAGLAAAMRLAENGCRIKLVSVTKVKRSHSVCAQGGINAAMNLKGEDDSPYIHAYDTIKGGDFLGDQPPVLEM